MSVRKAHNSGRNHLRNVVDYYQQIGHEKAQSVIDSITSSYAAEGQAGANPMLQQPGGMGVGGFGPPPPFGFPGRPGSIPPPFPPQGGPPNRNMPFPFPPPGGQGPNGMPFPPVPFPPQGFPGGAGSPPQNMPAFPPPGGFPPQGMPGFPPPMNAMSPGGQGGFAPPGQGPPGQGPPGR